MPCAARVNAPLSPVLNDCSIDDCIVCEKFSFRFCRVFSRSGFFFLRLSSIPSNNRLPDCSAGDAPGITGGVFRLWMASSGDSLALSNAFPRERAIEVFAPSGVLVIIGSTGLRSIDATLPAPPVIADKPMPPNNCAASWAFSEPGSIVSAA